MKIFQYRWRIKGQEFTGTKACESREALCAHLVEIGGELLEILSEADKPLPPQPKIDTPLPEEKPAVAVAPVRNLVLVGFWKRLLADVLDALFLGIIGFVIAFVLSPLIMPLGENGIWLGLLIAFLYTGILHSGVGQGQTIGKRILGIQVVRTDGSYLGVSRSFARYAVIALLCYNGAIFSPLYSAVPALHSPALGWIVPALLSAFFFGVSVFLAMHPLKQGFQDLLADSVVVARDSYSADQLQARISPAKVKDAWTVWCLCFMLALTGLWVFAERILADPKLWNELTGLHQKVAAEGRLSHITVAIEWNKFVDVRGDQVTTSSLTLRGSRKYAADAADDAGRELQEARLYAKLLSSYSRTADIDAIIVDIRSGFNLGIASMYSHNRYVFDPDGETLRERPQLQRRATNPSQE